MHAPGSDAALKGLASAVRLPQLPGEFIEAPRVDAGQQVSRMRLVVECGNRRCALRQTAAQRLVHHYLEGLLRFPCDLREPVGKIVFKRKGCSGSHRACTGATARTSSCPGWFP